jgi:membrane peptidoglycan carboxypeptidase
MNGVEHSWTRMLFRQISIVVGFIVNKAAKLLLSRETCKLRTQLKDLYHQYQFAIRSDVPPILVNALLECEDHRFYNHRGVDPFATVRALIKSISGCGIEGGSTIEQQFIRTITNRREITLRRKVREICLATLVEEVVPKRDIPALYLLVAYFGWRMNGLSQVYSRLNLQRNSLNLEEAATIVARLKYPEPRNPPAWRTNQIRQRQKHIIQLLHLRKKLSKKGQDHGEF